MSCLKEKSNLIPKNLCAITGARNKCATYNECVQKSPHYGVQKPLLCDFVIIPKMKGVAKGC